MSYKQRKRSGASLGVLLAVFLLCGFFIQGIGTKAYGLNQDYPVSAQLKEVIITEREDIPYRREHRLTPRLERGQINILQKGVSGLVQKTYLVSLSGGQEIKRQLRETVMIREPVPEITEIGTKDTIILSSRKIFQPRKEMLVQATAYTHTGHTTFTGVYPHVGTVAVDPDVIPLGSRMWIEGYGYGIAQDTGGLIKGNIIDLFMDTEAECWKWGRRTVKIYLLE